MIGGQHCQNDSGEQKKRGVSMPGIGGPEYTIIKFLYLKASSRAKMGLLLVNIFSEAKKSTSPVSLLRKAARNFTM
jgi:hypothetical protein